MARNENVSSIAFGALAINQPMSYRMTAMGDTIEDAVGVDTFISSNQLVRRRVEVRVSFKDWDDARTLVTAHWGTEATLVIKTRTLATTVDKTLTIANAMLRDVAIDAVYNDPGTHVATFVSRTTDGNSNPVS